MKLTIKDREDVADQATKKAYGKKLERAYAALVQPVMEAKLASGDRLARDIPAGWEKWIGIHHSATVYTCLDNILQDSVREDRSTAVVFPEAFVGDYNKTDFGGYNAPWEHPTVEKIRKIEKEKQDFYFDCLAVLNSCNTDAQLKATSPELFAFLRVRQPDNRQIVAVEIISKVTNMLLRQGNE